MEAYTGFAQVYDTFMAETPYREWAAYLSGLIDTYGISRPCAAGRKALEQERDLVVELGCGTGSMTEQMAALGYDMIGVDCSEEMLAEAMDKRRRSGHDILYLQQDMRRLDLYCTAGTMFSVCDSLNYLLEEDDLLRTFRQVYRFLYPGGIFVFDFNTVYKYAEVLGDTTIAENRDDCSFIWENYYDPASERNEYDLTLFVRRASGLFERLEETHVQRGYTEALMRRLTEEAGFSFVRSIDADTHGEVTARSERIYMIVRKRQEEGT